MTNLCPPEKLEGQRIILCACTLDHAKALYSTYTSDFLACEFLQRRPHRSIEETKTLIRNWGLENWDNGSQYAWSIMLDDMSPFGLFILILNENTAEIHFGVSRSMWNNGYATAAGLLIMDWIARHTRIQTVFTICDTEHEASLKVLQKIGLQKRDVRKNALFLPAKDSGRRDAYFMSWIRDEQI